jgi:Tfp pilus assembly protein PilN
MIEINLLPGAGKKNRKTTGFRLGAITSDAGAQAKNPFLLSAVGSVAVAAAAIGFMYVSQTARASDLTQREQRSVQDSTRYVAVLRERNKAESQRDSVQRALNIIKSIDNDRFVWPHILDEVSRALPPFTWLKSVQQLAATAPPQSAAPAAGAKKDDKPKDPVATADVLKFRIIGNTVDIQALTRFMKMLEMSPFVQNVQLARSELVMLDGKEVTEFHLDAEYQRPDASVVTTIPVSLSER